MLLVAASLALLSCSCNASGTSHIEKAPSNDIMVIETPNNYEFIEQFDMNVIEIQDMAAVITAAPSPVTLKVFGYWDNDLAAILIETAPEFNLPPDPMNRSAIGKPDTRRYFKWLFLNQKIC